MGQMRSSRVCEPIYTANNLYNDFIILQEFFLRKKYVFTYVTWILVLFTSYSKLSKFPTCSPHNTEAHDLVASFLNLRIKRVTIKTECHRSYCSPN